MHPRCVLFILMRVGFILLLLTMLGCSHRTTSKIFIEYDKQFGDISDGYPDEAKASTIKNSLGQVIAQGPTAVHNGQQTVIKIGTWKEFYENGNIKSFGEYKIGSFIDCCVGGACRSFYSYRIGLWRYFDINGSPDYEVEFSPETLKINTRCEGGDKLIFGLIKSIPIKYWGKLSTDKIYELQKIIVRDSSAFGTTTYTPLNGELFIEFARDK